MNDPRAGGHRVTQPDEALAHEALERLEWDERKEPGRPDRRGHQFTRRAALTGGAAGLVALALEACGGGGGSSAFPSNGASASAGIFGIDHRYDFTFVNHATTNAFFTPARNGADDACRLLGCSYQWTGSVASNVSEMVDAINRAVTRRTDGIATTLIDPTAFNSPVSRAISAGIPVVAYNSDVAGNPRLAYIGQDNFVSGQMMGHHIAALVPSGDVTLFIATPGAVNLQPRIDGVLATLKSYPSVAPHVVPSGAVQPQELPFIKSYMKIRSDYRGFFAVDGGSTAATAQAIQQAGLAAKGVKGGGYDLISPTEQLLAAGHIQFAIDQQPYLQGFLPVLELYLYNATQKLTGIADVDTGLKFLDNKSVLPYVTTRSRYEGTSIAAGVQKP